jgi:hypothetical protein
VRRGARDEIQKPEDKLHLGFELGHRPFTGRLDTPIVGTDQTHRERQEKLELLLEHYGISTLSDPKRWWALAYALAIDFVPGMQVLKRAPSKRGRPPTKNWGKYSAAKRLVEVIETIKLERKKGNLDAARMAIRRHPKAWPGISATSLVTRYYEARNLLSDVDISI